MKRIPIAMLCAAACALTAACAATPSAGPLPPAGGICNAGNAQFAAGRVLTAELENEARLRSGAALVRVVRPGQVVTMEFNERRLTLEVDAAGRVTRVGCG